MPEDYIDRIKELEEEIRRTQKNKATEHHLGLLKAKIAKLKKSVEKSGRTTKLGVKKEGDATVAMVGFPSVGKSTILNLLTGAKSKVAEYEFTTVDCIPGVMVYNDAKIQLLDLPGIIEGAHEGKGMGRAVLSYARMSDLILLVTDVERIALLDKVVRELHEANFRLNEDEPHIDIKVNSRGGINLSSGRYAIDELLAKDILREFGVHNCDVVFHEPFDADRLIDKLSRNRKYVKSIVVINKAEDVDKDEEKITLFGKEFLTIYISALKKKNIDLLKQRIWEYLDLIRVYTVKKNNEIDKPLIMRRGSTVKDLCMAIHKDLFARFRYAQVRGRSSKFERQKLGLQHVLEDGDIVTIFTR